MGISSGCSIESHEEDVCVVCNLLSRKFKCRTLKEKISIVKKGRPKPNLNISTPEKNFVRRFRLQLYDSKEWLTGCPHRQKLFCWCCLLFSKEKSMWTRVGFSDLGNVHKSIKNHSLSQSHLQAILAQKTFCKTRIDSENMTKDVQYDELVKKNREIIKRLIDIVCFFGKQELALRGHNESSDSSNKDNFVELVNLLCHYDYKLKDFVKAGSVFTEISNSIQNSLIESVGNILTAAIKQEIEETKYVAISVDEVTDVAEFSQLSIGLRYVTREGEVQERFLHFLNISDKSADVLYRIVTGISKEYNCVERLFAQSYDGAVIMTGNLTDLQVKVRQTCPHTLFAHSFAHRLNSVLSQATFQIRECRIFFLTINGIADFFSNSTKRTQALDVELQKRKSHIFQTQWNHNSRVVQLIFKYKKNFVSLFKRICYSDEKWDQDSYTTARGILSTMIDFDFNFLLEVFAAIFPITDNLDKFLRTESANIDHCVSKIGDIKSALQSKLKSFDEIWNKTCDVDTQEPDAKHPKGLDTNAHYKRLYYDILNAMLEQLDQRFSNLESLYFLELLDLTHFNGKVKFSFPERAFQSLKEAFGSVFDFPSLRSQLTATYLFKDMCRGSTYELLKFIKANGLEGAFNEVVKLCELLLTIPASRASVECGFSKLNDIKNYARKSQEGEERLTNLPLLALEKELLTTLQQNPGFYDKVIEDFARKVKRIQLLFK